MQNAALGLKSIFRSITSKSMLQGIFARFSPTLEVNWNVSNKDLPDELFKACAALRTVAKDEYANLVCALQEICDVVADSKSAERLLREVKDLGCSEDFTSFIRTDGKHLQNCVAWILLNAPEAWERLLVSAKAVSIRAKTIEEYSIRPANGPNNERLPRLRDAIAAYLVKETLHGEHVHVETAEDDNTIRYLFSVNSFPVNVQQFDDRGRYAVARDANATNFMIEYAKAKGILRIKCPFGAPKRRELVRLFADMILSAEANANGKQRLDLSRHLKECILPTPRNPRIVSVKPAGLTVAFCNGDGSLDSLTATTLGSTNLQHRIRNCLAASGVSSETVTVSAVEYTIAILTTSKAQKTVHVRATPDGFHFICRDRKEREIILDYLKEVFS